MGRSSWWTPLHHVFQFVLRMGEKLWKQPKASNSSQSRLFISKIKSSQWISTRAIVSFSNLGVPTIYNTWSIFLSTTSTILSLALSKNMKHSFSLFEKKNLCLTIGFIDWIWIDRWWMCLLHYIIGIIWRILWMGRSSWWTPLHHVFQFVLQMGEKLRKQPKASNSSQSNLFISKIKSSQGISTRALVSFSNSGVPMVQNTWFISLSTPQYPTISGAF